MVKPISKISVYFANIGVSIIGLIPLAYLGLITPHMFTAFLAGIADAALSGNIIISAFGIGYTLGEGDKSVQ